MQVQSEKFDVGGKRGRTPTSADPYTADEALPGIQVCRTCHAVYQNRSWTLDELVYGQALQQEHHLTFCPACRKIDQHYAEGEVTMSGDYLWEHEEQIRNLIRNEEQRALQKNPLERILRLEREGDRLILETTEIKLAEHLGRAIHKAHQGELHFSWEGNPVTCRVAWQRLL
jgi:hypothetical protein